MKVLIFTHKSDIDGMGGAVLAKLAFEDVTYVLTETFKLQNEIKKYYDNGSIYNYDLVFVTDLWLEEPMRSKVAKDERLKNKFFVFDHHESALSDNSNEYDFITIRISDQKGLCSGTSLFYEYLTNQGFLQDDDIGINDFQELTRRYDTWEWITKYNDELPHKLTLLFDSLGCDNYINLIYKKLMNHKNEKFYFDDMEEMLINNKLSQVEEKLRNYAKKIHYINIFGYKAGIVFIDYEYRNDLVEYFRKNKYEMDFAMLVAMDYGTISYRSVKEDVNVRLIAEKMGGKGHDKAASSPISDKKIQDILNILTNN